MISGLAQCVYQFDGNARTHAHTYAQWHAHTQTYLLDGTAFSLGFAGGESRQMMQNKTRTFRLSRPTLPCNMKMRLSLQEA